MENEMSLDKMKENKIGGTVSGSACGSRHIKDYQ